MDDRTAKMFENLGKDLKKAVTALRVAVDKQTKILEGLSKDLAVVNENIVEIEKRRTEEIKNRREAHLCEYCKTGDCYPDTSSKIPTDDNCACCAVNHSRGLYLS